MNLCAPARMNQGDKTHTSLCGDGLSRPYSRALRSSPATFSAKTLAANPSARRRTRTVATRAQVPHPLLRLILDLHLHFRPRQLLLLLPLLLELLLPVVFPRTIGSLRADIVTD